MKWETPLFNTRGLTLVELLASMGLLAILLSAVVPAWQSGLLLWQRQTGIMEMQRDERMVLDVMAKEIRRAEPGSVKIVPNSSDNQQPMLEFVDKNNGRVNYFKYQAGTVLMRRDDGATSVENPLLDGLNKSDGFAFGFFRYTAPGTRVPSSNNILDSNEVLEIIIRSNRGPSGEDKYEILTVIAPRNR
jgi:prepilin-type N-terminal cleavage/methylation domain-containing protein